MLGTRERRILEALAHGGEVYGRDLPVPWWSARYVTLGRMEERGLIEGRGEPGHAQPRRLYRITDAGRSALFPKAQVRP